MRRESTGTSGSLPCTVALSKKRNPRRVWFLTLFAALLPLIAVAAWGQTEGMAPKYKDPNDPKQTGPGQAAPWSVEGEPKTPPPRPKTEDLDRDPLVKFMRSLRKQPSGGVRCKILEVQDLGRLYVEDISGIAGGTPYWLQLPEEVKLVAHDPRKFDGRKKLDLDDLAIGQLLIVTLKERTGEIVKVRVRQPTLVRQPKADGGTSQERVGDL